MVNIKLVFISRTIKKPKRNTVASQIDNFVAKTLKTPGPLKTALLAGNTPLMMKLPNNLVVGATNPTTINIKGQNILQLRPSDIHAAGIGLFAMRNYNNGEPIIAIRAELLEKKTIDKSLIHSKYTWVQPSFPGNKQPLFAFCQYDISKSNLARYINSKAGTGKAANIKMEYYAGGTIAVVVASRKIIAGEVGKELLADYSL